VAVRVIASPEEHQLITTKPQEILKQQSTKDFRTPPAQSELQ